MTKSKGIGRGGARPGSGRPSTGPEKKTFLAVINGQRVAAYREYLELREGRAVEDKEIIEFVRQHYFEMLAGLDELVSKETEPALVF